MTSTHRSNPPVLAAAMLALACASPVLADDGGPAVVLHLTSTHSRSGFDNGNLGLAHQWANGVVVGAFHNSYGRTSAYAGWLWRIDAAGRWGLFLGGATGYGETDERLPIAPVLAPSIRLPLTAEIAARLSWFMDPREGAAQVLHLSLEVAY
jgi:hypothetical protein